jgi:acyl-CoA thioester hydrolase
MSEPLENDPRITWTTDVLRFGDTDKFGHVNNAVFATLCESGRVDFFRKRLDAALPPGAFWVIVRLAIEFRAELHYPGEVRTGTWPTKLGRSSVTFGQVLVSDGAQAATAENVCVLMDGATRRPLPLPDAARRIVEDLLRAPAEGRS